MNKAELVNSIAERMCTTHQEAWRFINAFQASLTEALKEDKSLMLQGFGTFQLWKQEEREGRNPRTGESCTIRPRWSAKFKPGKQLLKELNL